MKLRLMLIAMILAACAPTPAEDLRVEVHRVDASGVGSTIGTVVFSDGPAGLVIKPSLEGLPAGPHGLHVHENPSCDPAEKDGAVQPGLAAGVHYESGGDRAPRGSRRVRATSVICPSCPSIPPERRSAKRWRHGSSSPTSRAARS